ncbi:hypothetical protein TNCV_4669691 [Trichonephila clavipes]|nr:hypothetical protein TNCV_4669691 [Trichonephila clavipes]
MASDHSLPQINLSVQGGTKIEPGGSHKISRENTASIVVPCLVIGSSRVLFTLFSCSSNLSCRKFTKSYPSSDAKLTLKFPAKISGNV